MLTTPSKTDRHDLIRAALKRLEDRRPLEPHDDPHDLTVFWCLTRTCAWCGERKNPKEFPTKPDGPRTMTSEACRECREGAQS